MKMQKVSRLADSKVAGSVYALLLEQSRYDHYLFTVDLSGCELKAC